MILIWFCYQVDMIDKLLIPHFTHIDHDNDVEVRKMVVEMVIGMAQGCVKDEFFDLINIIEKVCYSFFHWEMWMWLHNGRAQQNQCYDHIVMKRFLFILTYYLVSLYVLVEEFLSLCCFICQHSSATILFWIDLFCFVSFSISNSGCLNE